MSKSIRTPLARVRGSGAAHDGVAHFIGQRASAAAMLVLAPWFLVGLLHAISSGYEAATAWLRAPLNAVLMILVIGAGAYHMRIGLQVIIEDYIARPLTRHILLLLNTLIACGLFLAAAYSIVRL